MDHELQKREDALRRGGRELGVNEPMICIASAHFGKSLAMVGPGEEDALGELVHVIVVVGRAGAHLWRGRRAAHT